MTAVRPPEFVPRLPYAALLLAARRLVLADTFPFSRQGHQNRARIRTSQGAAWLTVPRGHAGRPQAILDVPLAGAGWARRHVKAFAAAYGMAPYYDALAPAWADLVRRPYASLADLTCATVVWTARQLGAEAEVVRASALAGAPAALADVWRAAGGGSLLTLPESAARDATALPGVEVHVLDYAERPRRQAFAGFEPGLSVLDLLLNYGPAAADRLRDELTVRPLGASG